jgi:hypothetical protein
VAIKLQWAISTSGDLICAPRLLHPMSLPDSLITDRAPRLQVASIDGNFAPEGLLSLDSTASVTATAAWGKPEEDKEKHHWQIMHSRCYTLV